SSARPPRSSRHRSLRVARHPIRQVFGSRADVHGRLRRQLDKCCGEGPESSRPPRKLLRKLDKEYRRADRDRASLRHALALLSDLLERPSHAGRRASTSPLASAASRLFDQAPLAMMVCDADGKVTAWNAAAGLLFGIPPSEAMGRELTM